VRDFDEAGERELADDAGAVVTEVGANDLERVCPGPCAVKDVPKARPG